MNQTDLQQKVTDAVDAMFNKRMAFTNLDIAKPIIKADGLIRYWQIRDCINELWRSGAMDSAAYAVSMIDVYPNAQGPSIPARLFHPDEPGFDPSSYQDVRQVLIRNAALDNDSVSTPAPISLPTGSKVTTTCEVQKVRGTINVPKIVVSSAGFKAGDSFSVSADSNSLKIEVSPAGTQKVDSEGRIRLHGPNVNAINKTSGDPCVVMTVEDSGKVYIQIQ